MNSEDFANLIRLARRAPLANMDEAEAAAMLLQKFAAFAQSYLEPSTDNQSTDKPQKPAGNGADLPPSLAAQ